MLWNSIKMAFKSLWASKMRTFLTMLGVIIGVTTVALLTTVSNGATESIMDALGKESRSVTMVAQNSNNPLTMEKLNGLIDGLKNDGSTGQFIYTAVAKNDVVVDRASHLIEVSTGGEMGTAVMRVGSTVNGVDENFINVRGLKIEGNFVSSADECVVDRAFINAYLKGKTDAEVLESTVVLGGKIESYNYIFTSSSEADIAKFYSELKTMCARYGIRINDFDDTNKTKDGGVWKYADSIAPIQYFDPATLEIKVKEHIDGLSDYSFSADYEIEIDETFVGGKTYKIVGILVQEDNALMGSDSMSSMGAMGGTLAALAEYSKTKQGNVYVGLADENASLFGDFAAIDEVSLNGAYFLFDSEDDIDTATVNIGLGMINLGYKLFQDCYIVPMKTVSEIMGTTMDIMTVLLTVIASISLIIGGIGIMNIMLVAVSERTREIGIRKAIGAKKSSILLQFLIEALVVSFIGGAIGLLISFIGSIIIGAVMAIPMVMPLWVIGMSVGFCLLIGVIFGMYPAIKAANLMPIDALRHD